MPLFLMALFTFSGAVMGDPKKQSYLCVVPHLSPVVCGVSDYAQLLAQALSVAGWNATFAVPEGRGGRAGSFDVKVVQSGDVASWRDLFSEYRHVVVMYSGYGYDENGAPVWLVDALEDYQGLLIVHFHEPFALSANPFSRTYWVSGKQKVVAARLLEYSDSWITSNDGYAALLCELGSEQTHAGHILKTPSNIGEPNREAVSNVRTSLWVVAGTIATRQRTYRSLSKSPWLATCGRVMDIGSERVAVELLPENTEVLGQLSTTDFSKALLAAEAGLLTYQPRYLDSSGVFAMYCAHGLNTLLWPRAELTEQDHQALARYSGFVCLVDKSIELPAFKVGKSPPSWEYYQTCVFRDHATLYMNLLECGYR